MFQSFFQLLNPNIFYHALLFAVFIKVSTPLNCSYGTVSNGTGCEDCGRASAAIDLRIVGGIPATANSWPSHAIVGINYKTKYKFYDGNTVNITQYFECGGTLINHYTVITGGHCEVSSFYYVYRGGVFNIAITLNEYYPTYESMYQITLGAHDKSNPTSPSFNRSISKIIMNPNYDQVNYINDSMLLILSEYVAYSPYIQPACLPPSNNANFPPPGTTAYAVGWGQLSYNGPLPSILQNVKLQVYDSSYCSAYSAFSWKQNWQAQICCGNYNGGQDACEGDSGGGLYTFDKNAKNSTFRVLSGITSYGYDCAQATFPGIYTRVSYQLEWIYNNWVVDRATSTSTRTTQISTTTTKFTSSTTTFKKQSTTIVAIKKVSTTTTKQQLTTTVATKKVSTTTTKQQLTTTVATKKLSTTTTKQQSTTTTMTKKLSTKTRKTPLKLKRTY